MDWGPRITYLASTAFKDRVVPFGIKDEDRQKHVCVLGKVGSGRGNLLSRMALQDIERGLGTLIIDAGGNLAPIIMERLSRSELDRLVHIDAADAEYPFSWNIPNEFRHSDRGSELWRDALASVYSTPRSALTDFLADWVLADPNRTLLSAFTVLAEDKDRDASFPPESDEGKKLAELRTKHATDATTFVENGRFLIKDTMVRNVLGQRDGKFSFASLAEGSIFVLDLSRVRIFPTRVQPLVRLFTYAFRAQTAGSVTGTAYFHDVLRYLTDKDADDLLADQSYALTLSDTVYRESDMPMREKALSRCGSVVTFAPHQSDVALVQRIFYPYVTPEELQGLEHGEACVMLTIDANRARPFFANALELGERKSVSLQDILVESRRKYTTPRSQVDELFKKQSTPTPPDKGKGPSQFNDAFKDIFAKRDPANFLAPSAAQEKKTEQKAPEQKVETPKTPTPEPAPAKPEMPRDAVKDVPKELEEDELKALLFVAPLPA